MRKADLELSCQQLELPVLACTLNPVQFQSGAPRQARGAQGGPESGFSAAGTAASILSVSRSLTRRKFSFSFAGSTGEAGGAQGGPGAGLLSSWSCPSGASWRQDMKHLFWVKFSLCDCVSAGAAGEAGGAQRGPGVDFQQHLSFMVFQIA